MICVDINDKIEIFGMKFKTTDFWLKTVKNDEGDNYED